MRASLSDVAPGSTLIYRQRLSIHATDPDPIQLASRRPRRAVAGTGRAGSGAEHCVPIRKSRLDDSSDSSGSSRSCEVRRLHLDDRRKPCNRALAEYLAARGD